MFKRDQGRRVKLVLNERSNKGIPVGERILAILIKEKKWESIYNFTHGLESINFKSFFFSILRNRINIQFHQIIQSKCYLISVFDIGVTSPMSVVSLVLSRLLGFVISGQHIRRSYYYYLWSIFLCDSSNASVDLLCFHL